ncbi:hypothetical protein B0H14DRAFT_2609634 [Mycena olivaceomarginata]|nr:hypothetical protein B0H14DRAFT_2609634 [Mycena olivaceomarginata]
MPCRPEGRPQKPPPSKYLCEISSASPRWFKTSSDGQFEKNTPENRSLIYSTRLRTSKAGRVRGIPARQTYKPGATINNAGPERKKLHRCCSGTIRLMVIFGRTSAIGKNRKDGGSNEWTRPRESEGDGDPSENNENGIYEFYAEEKHDGEELPEESNEEENPHGSDRDGDLSEHENEENGIYELDKEDEDARERPPRPSDEEENPHGSDSDIDSSEDEAQPFGTARVVPTGKESMSVGEFSETSWDASAQPSD